MIWWLTPKELKLLALSMETDRRQYKMISYTIVHGVQCTACGSPIVATAEPIGDGGDVEMGLQCIAKCPGNPMRNITYPNHIQMKKT
jgi:hypothetical protein